MYKLKLISSKSHIRLVGCYCFNHGLFRPSLQKSIYGGFWIVLFFSRMGITLVKLDNES